MKANRKTYRAARRNYRGADTSILDMLVVAGREGNTRAQEYLRRCLQDANETALEVVHPNWPSQYRK